jgi:hypothetical protein
MSLKNVPVEGLHCVKCKTDSLRFESDEPNTSIYANRCTICYEWKVPLTPENCARGKNGVIPSMTLKYFRKRLGLDI